MTRVRDLVHQRDLFRVEEHQSVAEVAQAMAGFHVGAILVLKGDELRGIFSERDLMVRVVLERRDPDRTPVREVMTRDVSTIDECATPEEAMEAMQAQKCNDRALSGRRIPRQSISGQCNAMRKELLLFVKQGDERAECK